jgi:CcmD family protein
MKRIATVIFVLALGLPVFTQSVPASGGGQPPPKQPTAAQDGFVPIDAPVSPQDVMPAPRLVAIAYGFIWVVIFGYVWSVQSRLSRVERELDAVSRRVPARK